MNRSAGGMFVHSCLELFRAQVLRCIRVILANGWRKNHVAGMQSANVCCFANSGAGAALLSLYLFQIKTHRLGHHL